MLTRCVADRVFSQCLTAVRQISRFASRRPPSHVRAKLYGLYKQGVEGDLEQLVGRPDVSGEEQDKWDAWSAQSGLSKTEAKKHYIELLIETMHEYASETADARELVTELEFVYNQIKDNSPPGTESSHSDAYGLLSASHGQAPGAYPLSPLPTPGLQSQSRGGLQELAPLSHDEVLIEEEQAVALQAGLRSPELENELFVDAPEQSVVDEDSEQHSVAGLHSSTQQQGRENIHPDSEAQTSSHEDTSPAESPFPRSWPQQSSRPVLIKQEVPSSTLESQLQPVQQVQPESKRNAASALLAKYLPSTSKPVAALPTSDTAGSSTPSSQSKWHRRIETSLIRLTTEVTALREQLEIQQQQYSSYGSLFPLRGSVSFPSGPNGGGVGKLSFGDLTNMYGRLVLKWLVGVTRHVMVDAAVILAVWLYLKKRRGWNNERFAQEVVGVLAGVSTLFGPLVGAWNGAMARMPNIPVRIPGLQWLSAWLRTWGQMLLGLIRARKAGLNSSSGQQGAKR